MASTITSILETLRITSPTRITPLPMVKREIIANEMLPEITLNEVAFHDDYQDCWIIVYDRVYDVTNFLQIHPGGEDIIMDHAGRDATLAFHGTGHSKAAIAQLREYLIGELPPNERIFRTNERKVLSYDVPE